MTPTLRVNRAGLEIDCEGFGALPLVMMALGLLAMSPLTWPALDQILARATEGRWGRKA